MPAVADASTFNNVKISPATLYSHFIPNLASPRGLDPLNAEYKANKGCGQVLAATPTLWHLVLMQPTRTVVDRMAVAPPRSSNAYT